MGALSCLTLFCIPGVGYFFLYYSRPTYDILKRTYIYIATVSMFFINFGVYLLTTILGGLKGLYMNFLSWGLFCLLQGSSAEVQGVTPNRLSIHRNILHRVKLTCI